MKRSSQKMFPATLILISLLCGFYFVSAQAYAQGERILSFVSDIHINADASADVTETIQVVAEQVQIQHGIFRVLLTQFPDSEGKTQNLDYEVQQIYLDSQPSPFHIQHESRGFVIYVGSKDWLLPPGTYQYTLRYHVGNAVSFLKRGDEFYWNITGNNWGFPIEEAEANIYLPEGVAITEATAYTGTTGEKGKDFTSSSSDLNEISYVVNRTLRPGEGLTVAIAWPKGLIQQPTTFDRFKAIFINNRNNFISLQILILLVIYYGAVWCWEGREPPEGVIFPLYEPPADISPEGMRFVSQMAFDYKTFATAIVNLATAGFLKIKELDGAFLLLRQKEGGKEATGMEGTLVDQLFAEGDTLALNNTHSEVIGPALAVLKNNLKMECENVYFITHAVYLIPGFILGLLAMAAAMQILDLDVNSLMVALFFIGAYAGLLYLLFLKNQTAITEALHDSSFSKLMMALLYAFLFLLLMGAGLFALWDYGDILPAANVGLLIANVFINLVFYHLLKVHTPQGRKLMDKIEGFKMFLGATEQDRLQRLNPPAKTPELFEKYLPYALALDLENSWGEQFTEVLQKAGINNQPYQPVWYIGDRWDNSNPAGFSRQLGLGLASSLATSSVSASSGGGFSGGGGGGGGGGGW